MKNTWTTFYNINLSSDILKLKGYITYLRPELNVFINHLPDNVDNALVLYLLEIKDIDDLRVGKYSFVIEFEYREILKKSNPLSIWDVAIDLFQNLWNLQSIEINGLYVIFSKIEQNPIPLFDIKERQSIVCRIKFNIQLGV